MNRPLLFLLLLAPLVPVGLGCLLFLCCAQPADEQSSTSGDSTLVSLPDTIPTTPPPDIIQDIPFSTQLPDSGGCHGFYPVYTFSKNTYGIFLPIPDNDDTWRWFERKYPNNHLIGEWRLFFEEHPEYPVVDSFPRQRIYTHDSVTAPFSHLVKKPVMVIGQKGIMQAHIRDVVFSLTLCGSNFFVLRLTPVDTDSIGEPLFATGSSDVSLTFGASARRNAKMDTLSKQDFWDPPAFAPAKVAASTDSISLVYSDWFNWREKRPPWRKYPTRFIIVKPRKGKEYVKMLSLIDITGSNCE